MSTRAFRSSSTKDTLFNARLTGRKGAVATQHYLSAEAGVEVLRSGGNAADAAAAAILVEGLVNPQMHTLGGECPILVYVSDEKRVYAINGNTAAPGLATPEAFTRRGLRDVPSEGILAAGVPAALGAVVTLLERFGRQSFAAVASAALSLATDGFPAHRGLLRQERFGISDLEGKFRDRWPGSSTVYLPDGVAPAEGAILRNPAFAAILEYLISRERKATTRSGGLCAVLDGFYRGEPASIIDRFSRDNDGLLRREDLERFETLVEESVSIPFAGATLHKCGPWNQGPVLLQTLRILQNFNLSGMGHNSTAYVHHVVEAMKLAFADREQYYADPLQTAVPIDALLSEQYGARRAALIDSSQADLELRPGDPVGDRPYLPIDERLGGKAWGPGTVHVDTVDAHGNMVAATPSGAWIMSSEVVPGLGFPLGNRLMTFYINPPHHPNRIAPYKRPRTTISPSLALRNGEGWLAFGSMGGDQQDQWQLQFFLNVILFGMSLPEAIEAPKFSSEHFPGFFAPHDFFRKRLRIEPRVGEAVIEELRVLGHDIEIGADWSEGYLLAASRDPETGLLEAAADPRGSKGEIFPAAARCI